MTAAITVDRLTKRYGVHAAIDSISFEVARGEVVGFLGPNGAGKSTTLRILAGFLGATSGRALIEGHDVVLESHRAREATGYMPEAVPLYGEMRVREYLRFRAELKGVKRSERTSAVGRAMELAHIEDVADTLIEHLSKGYRQRTGLADALVAKPRLLILDEPTAGMDPNQIREVRSLVKGLGGEQTVLLSTHILSEVEASCARVIVIDRGKLVAEGKPGELSPARAARSMLLVLRGEERSWRKVLDSFDGCTIVEATSQGETWRVNVELVGDRAEELVEKLVAAKVGVREIAPSKTSLEDVFAAITHSEPEEEGEVEAANKDEDEDAS